MKAMELIESLEWLRKDIIGRNKLFSTPFGEKPLVYADYTASGRSLYHIENYMLYLQQFYANTHTEDDFTGKIMTTLMHQAEKEIKQAVNAGKCGKIIFCGSGATAAITKLQQIIGVYWPPATEKRMEAFIHSCLERYQYKNGECHQKLLNHIETHKPIVFIGPYEHHSNEIMWRETLCDVVEIPLNPEGKIDLEELEKAVSNKQYSNRPKIGSFSAASNVSGIKTPVYEVARILHKHNALACFDFAACAPYVEIDMNHDEESYFDAIFLSPHKCLGGPGTSGVLVFNEKIYRKDLPPTVAGGGTVDFVTMDKERYIEDVETREKAGTPAILQNIKTALVFQLKEKIGIENIELIEHFFLKEFYQHFENEERIVFYGAKTIEEKVNIIPFNIRHKDKYLHPKFVTKLLNDLFGIQTRAGCSCAGPYGHRLLNIDNEISRYYQCLIGVDKYHGIKPGWVRLNLHYAFSMCEFDYLIAALKFVIYKAHLFLPFYDFDIMTGDWKFIGFENQQFPYELDIDKLYQLPPFQLEDEKDLGQLFTEQLNQAEEIANKLQEPTEFMTYDKKLEELMIFYVPKRK
jgi:selenocysteine lyase/cysteine desulfurase